MNCSSTTFSGHAIKRMFARSINSTMVKTAISEGEIIIEYLDDQPYPSFLILWFDNKVPLHVVVAQNRRDDLCYIITAYIPSGALWEADFKMRKPS